jgi:hypothetical protein
MGLKRMEITGGCRELRKKELRDLHCFDDQIMDWRIMLK